MEIIDELREFILTDIACDLGIDLRTLGPDEDLFDHNIIDSMGILKVISFIEKKFSIKVANQDILPENFRTLNSLRKMIEFKKSSDPTTK